jgi:hypothetical protein
MVKVEGTVPRVFIDEYGDLLGLVDFAEEQLVEEKERRWANILREVDLKVI